MASIGETWRKLTFFFRRSQLDRDLVEEMRLHVEMKAQSNRSEGMSDEEARYAAQRQLGNLTLLREDSRQSWGFPLLESVVQDTRYGIRGLFNSPGFTLVAVVTLALGIGATTAIFSVANTVLLQPLPYKDSTRLVNISTVTPLFPEFQLGQSIPNLRDIRTLSRSFETVAAYQPGTTALTGSGRPEQIVSASVTSDFFPLFQVQPKLGRELLPEDEQLKNGNVVWLSHRMWQRRFGSDLNIVGRGVILEQKSYTIAGVLPAEFAFPAKTEVWMPLVLNTEQQTNRSNWMFFTLGKLRRGVTLPQAQSDLEDVARRIGLQNPKDGASLRFPVKTLHQKAVSEKSRSLLLMLLGAVGFLLLIACANVGNLMLARGLQRQREIAVRAALGATRSRILRQLLVESLVLSLAGGAAGLLLALVGVRAFRSFAPLNFARLSEVGVSPAMAALAFAIACATGVLCGIAPALHASRSNLDLAIKQRGDISPASNRLSVRSFLVVTEIALALILLTGSALMTQSLLRVLKTDTGFRTDHILTAKLRLNATNFSGEDAQRLFTQRLLTGLHAQPGFSGAGISDNSLMEGASLITFDPANLGLSEKPTNVQSRVITPGFLETMGIRLRSGRLFTDRDTTGSPNVALVNESMAWRFFPGRSPLGALLKFGAEATDRYEIVGVVADTRDVNPGVPPRPQAYLSLLQFPFTDLYVVVRSGIDPAGLTSQLQNCVWAIDKDLPLTDVRTMSQAVAATVSEPRFHTWLLSAFAGAGLGLTLIGIYGVISYSVGQRTHEMGIRIALGAHPKSVLRLVLSQGIRLAVLGAFTGVIGSLALTRFLANQLYEIKPHDPVTLACVALVMLCVALGASYLPARRATRVDPMVALRCE